MGDRTVVHLIPRERQPHPVMADVPARVIPMVRKAQPQPVPVPAVAGSGWYHDAAIAETTRPTKG